MRLIPFIALTSAGCLLWAAALTLAGLLAGSAWATVSSTLGRVFLVAGLAVVALWAMRGSRSH
jgi:membrane protein DedA with SNARE-associated domain